MCLPYFSWIVILWGCELLLLRLSASSGYSWNLSNPSHSFLKYFKNSICTEVGIYEGEISYFDLRRVGFQLLYIFQRSEFMKERKLALMLERLVSNYHIIFLVSVSNRLGLSCLFVILFCVFIWYCFETVLKCSRHRNKKTKPLAIFHHFAVLVCMRTVQLYLPVCVLYSSISAFMCTVQLYLPECESGT